MRRSMWRNPWALIAAALAGMAAVYAFIPDPVEVDVGRVARGPLVATIDEEGRTSVRRRFTISAPVGGSVLRIERDEGDCVESGTVVARMAAAAPTPLDTRTLAQLRARVEAAEDLLERARADERIARAAFEYAASDMTRAERLGEAGAVSRGDVELASTRRHSAEGALRASEAAVRAAAHELDEARAALIPAEAPARHVGGVTIRAPVSGTVLRVFQESERVVLPGTPLLEIGDPSDLEVVVDLLSSDAVNVPRGARVLLERWGGAAPLQGRVRLVEPASFTKVSALGVEEQRVNVFVELTDTVTRREGLGDGYAVDVRIVIAERASALKMSAGAIVPDGDRWAAFVLESGRARLRPVEIGLRAGYEVEVLAGLNEGDEVILHPGERVGDGTRVTRR